MSLGAHQQRGQDCVVADMGADIDEGVAGLQLLDEGAGQPLLEEAVLVELHPDEVRQMHLHVAAKECLGGDGPGQAGGIEQPGKRQPERQTAQSHLAWSGTQFGLAAQTFQQGITWSFHHAKSFLVPPGTGAVQVG